MTDKVKEEIRKRIMIAVHAYAYEIMFDPLIDDHTYDRLAREIDLTIDTGNKVMDKFFKENYDADTGMWIYKHPDLQGIDRYYNSLKEK